MIVKQFCIIKPFPDSGDNISDMLVEEEQKNKQIQ